MIDKKPISIYVHIPFCMSKCSYCSFISKCGSKEEIDEYIKCLNVEILSKSGMFKERLVKTIYIGGGTPSIIDKKYIEQILNTIKEYYDVAKNAEISIECNPCSCTTDKLKTYLKCGINRISFGVQSLNSNCLKIINRKHTPLIAINAVKMAKKVGFKNISCDLLIGIPNQTTNMLLDDINTLASLGITHFSAYMLMLEEGTKLYEDVFINRTQKPASDDECVDMYHKAYELLKALGYNRYEISNFAKKDYECKHNINYWDMGEYVGFGLSAHSFYNNTRIAGFEKLENYCKYIKEKYILRMRPFALPKSEVLTNQEKIEECLMLGLRQTKGVNLQSLKNLNFDILKEKAKAIEQLKNNNFIDIANNHLFITPQNFGATNQIILELLP